MDIVNSLINTSVSDAKSSLECMLASNPQDEKELAQKVLDRLGKPSMGCGNMTRISMLRTIVHKAEQQ
ncbi:MULTISPECIES: hypothetical protein [unclassified Vibrio]|uniref:hypothetical protein n=1 Tax=unclassified Vibrio TaxID=2614977 RepID=UPI000B8EE1DA|nr:MULTISPECIES: hypothetical protein [unclassified Vibrio]NAW98623.1 hypothetical protein [Vibrio sp. V23_P3S9T160]OXX23610.1 hypothetical protein B9J88_07570 [Vibrio sp. V05_P4A8T149]OXX29939.1 hypothetical protein B9J81_17030 [Vibrio sp. V04_P4A5T148]OXX32432.1 hypothetical protein B9J95_07215 [Vibrio sp. V14_P6S14T42]OXX49380.1 hypothetical protein B9J85_00775 [Vibrio sp. V11_P1A41T118]